MPKVIITQGFIADLKAVESDRVISEIVRIVELLEVMPSLGSRNLPNSIRMEFGNNARKIPVNPFDIITLYDEVKDEIVVAALIFQRAAW